MHNLKTILIVFAAICFIAYANAGTIILDFHAQPGLNKVVLKWTSQTEINLKGFEVERSFESKIGKFKKLDFIKTVTGNTDRNRYEYEDKSVFKSLERTFHYRLKIIDLDGTSSYSKVISVSPTISSVRQTWGSIKAMFR